jgi:rhodanese-related sulfurtransferase
MKKFVWLLFVFLLAFPMLMISAQEDVVTARLEEFGNNLPRGYGLISVEDLSGMLSVQELVLLDVRETDEYTAGHLEGAFNVPLRTLAQNLNLLPDQSATIVVICKGGGRASLASTVLQILGYENVKVLKGGYDGWAAEELPTTTEAYVSEVGLAPEVDATIFAAVDTYLTTLPEGFGLVSAPNLMAEIASNPQQTSEGTECCKSASDDAEFSRDSLLLIDVRSDEEWSQGYIAGAQHLWIDEFVSHLADLPSYKDTPIVVYCQSGYRGGMAAVMLNLLGYTNVRNLSGGVNSWTAAGLPLAGVPLDLNTVMADYVSTLPETFNGLAAADFSAELETTADVLLLDVRMADEYAEGLIEGAVNVPLNELTQHLDLLPNLDQNILVYCGSGHRSAIAMASLNLLGYTQVRSLLGGFGAWTAAELPVSQTPVASAGGTAPAVDPALLEAVNTYLVGIPAGYYSVRALDLSSELVRNPPLLIDVRSDSEWSSGHLEGAILMPLSDFFTLEAQLPQDMTAPIVVYDNPTHRSSMVMTFLRLLGYENVRTLAGGIGAWQNAELPLVTQ